MLMTIPIEARNGHEQERETPTRHSAHFSGRLGLFCRTYRLDPAAPGAVPQAKALSSQASGQGAGISGGHPSRVTALAGYQPSGSSLDKDQAVAEAWDNQHGPITAA